LERSAEAHAAELTRLDTTPERAAQLRGYLAAYLEMGRIIDAIAATTERMEDANRQRDKHATDASDGRRNRFWGSPYRV